MARPVAWRACSVCHLEWPEPVLNRGHDPDHPICQPKICPICLVAENSALKRRVKELKDGLKT